MKKNNLSKLSLNKLQISRLTSSDNIKGGSGDVFCNPGDDSRPLNNCPPRPTCFRTRCDSCITDQANGC